MKIRFATIGTSKITDHLLEAAALCPDFCHQAVYSRSLETAQAFAKKHGVSQVYTSLSDLAASPDIDAVYIASPNAFHARQAIQMLEAGKHVLCEKTIASNQQEAALMYETAKKHHVILLEAMRSLPDPGFAFIKNVIPTLGAIRHVTFSFCQYSSRYDRFKAGESFNIFSTEMSAGALMDIGVYCVEPLIALFDAPESFEASAVMLPGEIDGNGMILARYPDMTACLLYSKITDGMALSEIQGELGGLTIDAIACPHHVDVKYRDGRTDHYHLENDVNNMHYEVQHFINLIHQETFPEEEMHITMTSLQLMDAARKQLDIHFPADMQSLS